MPDIAGRMSSLVRQPRKDDLSAAGEVRTVKTSFESRALSIGPLTFDYLAGHLSHGRLVIELSRRLFNGILKINYT